MSNLLWLQVASTKCAQWRSSWPSLKEHPGRSYNIGSIIFDVKGQQNFVSRQTDRQTDRQTHTHHAHAHTHTLRTYIHTYTLTLIFLSSPLTSHRSVVLYQILTILGKLCLILTGNVLFYEYILLYNNYC